MTYYYRKPIAKEKKSKTRGRVAGKSIPHADHHNKNENGFDSWVLPLTRKSSKNVSGSVAVASSTTIALFWE